ncbi:hypothetical protein NITHO_1660017 [Nitrolancea hollandica Lb]|uniref:Uncharacterized protein n=1 Tax=Nitrolancea hollandica Lb TaxID=1129897 RepID=I4EE12_9BACT|nr:hypothetical protein NITHO_1660017 [Nitrolancea hollandica Lb]
MREIRRLLWPWSDYLVAGHFHFQGPVLAIRKAVDLSSGDGDDLRGVWLPRPCEAG